MISFFAFSSSSVSFLLACHKLNASKGSLWLPLYSLSTVFFFLTSFVTLASALDHAQLNAIKNISSHTHTHTHPVSRMSLSCFGPSQLNPVSCDSLASYLKLCQRLSKWYVPATATDGKGGYGKARQFRTGLVFVLSHKENQLTDTFAITFNWVASANCRP